MAVYCDAMHGRLKLIIKCSGGYNEEHVIEKLSKHYDLGMGIVREVVSITRNNKLFKEYMLLIKDGSTIGDIEILHRRYIQREEQKISRAIGSLLSIGGCNNLFR